MARRLLPAAIIVPLLAGALTLYFERQRHVELRSRGRVFCARERRDLRRLRLDQCCARRTRRRPATRGRTRAAAFRGAQPAHRRNRARRRGHDQPQGNRHRLELAGREAVRLAAHRSAGPRARRPHHPRAPARAASQRPASLRRNRRRARAEQAHRDVGAASRRHTNSRWNWRSRRSASATTSCSARFIRDITGRVRAEAALRESEQRFRTTANAAPVLIWMSGTDKRCTWFNQRWLDFVGRDIEQELGDGWCDNLHPADFDRTLDTYHAAFDARRPYEMEFRLQRDDGAWRWLLERGTPASRTQRRVRGLHRHLHRHHRAPRNRRAVARESRALQDAGGIAAADDLDLPARWLHRLREPAVARLHRAQRIAAAGQRLAGAGASGRSRQGADGVGARRGQRRHLRHQLPHPPLRRRVPLVQDARGAAARPGRPHPQVVRLEHRHRRLRASPSAS